MAMDSFEERLADCITASRCFYLNIRAQFHQFSEADKMYSLFYRREELLGVVSLGSRGEKLH